LQTSALPLGYAARRSPFAWDFSIAYTYGTYNLLQSIFIYF